MSAATYSASPVFFSYPNHHYCHRVRIALAEKGINCQIVWVDEGDEKPEDLAHLNPYNTIPFLVDRELKLYDPNSIIAYIDERYGQNPLYGQTPQIRAMQRQNLWQIEKDWFKVVDVILTNADSFDAQQARMARQELSHTLLQLSPIFADSQYFLGDSFSILDCAILPILWRVDLMQLQLPAAKIRPLAHYFSRVAQRPSVLASLSAVERYAKPKSLIVPL